MVEMPETHIYQGKHFQDLVYLSGSEYLLCMSLPDSVPLNRVLYVSYMQEFYKAKESL